MRPKESFGIAMPNQKKEKGKQDALSKQCAGCDCMGVGACFLCVLCIFMNFVSPFED